MQKLTPLRKATLLATLSVTLVGAGYSALSFAQSYHNKFAQKIEVAQRFDTLQLEVLMNSIRNYEDQIFSLEFIIAEGNATSLDKAKKLQVERRLAELLAKIALIRSPSL